MCWYSCGEFSTEPLKARDLEIKKLNTAIENLTKEKADILEIKSIERIIERLKSIPDEHIGVCSVCYSVYDTRYSYSVCSDSCFRDRFM